MLITLSPAKLLDFKTPSTSTKKTEPIYMNKARELNSILKKFSVEKIADLMNISPSITMEVYEYIHNFEMKDCPRKQAAFAFNGIAYQGLDAETLNEASLNFAQNHLITLSGLYGMIRPLDMIYPYRLEMGREVENPKGKNLYAYWSETLTKEFDERLLKDDNTWINLASNEYGKVINKRNLNKKCTIITPKFYELKDDKPRQVVVYTKKARGMLSRFIIENQLKEIDHIKAFDYEGYSFSPNLSSKKEWCFVR